MHMKSDLVCHHLCSRPCCCMLNMLPSNATQNTNNMSWSSVVSVVSQQQLQRATGAVFRIYICMTHKQISCDQPIYKAYPDGCWHNDTLLPRLQPYPVRVHWLLFWNIDDTQTTHTCEGCAAFQEMDLLEHAASIPPEQRQQPPRPPPPDVMQHLLGAASTLQRQRQNLQAQVFRPTVALPTVSVEQQVAVSNHINVSLTTCICQVTW